MKDFYEIEPIPLNALKAVWDALSDAEQQAYRDDYAAQVVSSHHDAGDHPFHRILSESP